MLTTCINSGSDMLNAHFGTDNNVADKYKGKSVEEIRADLDTKRSNFVFCFENINGDFNLATCIRCVNAFSGESIYVVGRKKWDRRGAVGTHHYENLNFRPDFSWLQKYKEKGYTVVAAEIREDLNPVSLFDFQWPEKVVVLFGEECRGLSEEALSLVDKVVYIPQTGSVRSLNVGVAAGIFLFHYNLQKVKNV